MTHPREQLVGYVLGELTDRERADVEAHVDRCEACRAEVRDLERMWVASVESLPPVAPPDGTWAAIEARVGGQEARRGGAPAAKPPHDVHGPVGRERPTRPGRSAPSPRRGGAAIGWMRVALAVALVLVAGSGWWGIRQAQQHAHASRETAVIADWLARPNVQRVDLAASGKTVGAALVAPDGHALLVLPSPPSAGHSYQAWGLANGTAVSLGVTQRRAIEVPTRGYSAVAISLEPRGGSLAPTQVLGSAPVS